MRRWVGAALGGRRLWTASRRGILSIVGGTAIGQLAALVAAPVITRLYTPDDLGVYAVLAASVLTVGTVSSLRLDLAVPLPDGEREAYSLVGLGLATTVATAVVGTVAVAVLGDRAIAAFGFPDLMPWLWFVPSVAATFGMYLVLNQLAIRNRRYGAVARRNVLQQMVMIGSQVVAGAASIRPSGLFLGLGLAQTVGAASLTWRSGLRRAEARAGLRLAEIRSVARRYRRFPLLLAPSGLLNVLGLQLPVVLVAYWYGSESAGLLALSQRVLALPVTLVGTAIGQVYLGEVARKVRTDPAAARLLFRRSTLGLGAFAAALFIALATAGPWAFSGVFGQEWQLSGEFARALAAPLAAQVIAAPLSQTLIVLERLTFQVAWDSLRVVALSLAVTMAALRGAEPLTAVWVLGFASTVTYLMSWLLSWVSLKTLTAPSSVVRRDGFGQ